MNLPQAPSFHKQYPYHIYIYIHLNEPSYHKSLGYHNSNHPQTVRLHNPVHTPPTNRATALPKLQPTTEETTPDPHPITDSLLVTTTKLSPITVNHHQPKPRMPSVLAESAQIALPKLQPTTEETTPDPHPITDSLLVTTTKLSPITVNHHQPKPRMPSVLAESAQIGPLHLKTLPDMEFRSQRPPPNL
jgi:hypothetical protein